MRLAYSAYSASGLTGLRRVVRPTTYHHLDRVMQAISCHSAEVRPQRPGLFAREAYPTSSTDLLSVYSVSYFGGDLACQGPTWNERGQCFVSWNCSSKHISDDYPTPATTYSTYVGCGATDHKHARIRGEYSNCATDWRCT